jgi:predicted nuclease of predicted toxin-antitoxin system
MNCRFYLDEDINVLLKQALINRGADVLSTLKAGNTGNKDEEQLIYATNENRIIITHNIEDFVKLHEKFLKNNRIHSGILLTDQLPIGVLLKRIMQLWFTLDANDMESRIEFLSNWR